ncbi:hypothetical protein BDV96DRAFT_239522 [Lophiotrema nucula]|uniref:Uncharacterized protein n=1 Tax=Lophiotrema nucula TaxID=690887 RepID=A0A6A5YRG7_9PLEO|nr:hypothetical protein BDV96DRAFT_239522 [Lophiotrema nucula]
MNGSRGGERSAARSLGRWYCTCVSYAVIPPRHLPRRQYSSIAAMSSPEPELGENAAPYGVHNLSKEYRDWHQLQFVAIPLLNALHRVSLPQLGDVAFDYSDDARLSPTPSLMSDDSSEPQSPSLSPRLPSYHKLTSNCPRRQNRRPRRNPSVAHGMDTRGTCRRPGAVAFWELDRTGRVAKRVYR